MRISKKYITTLLVLLCVAACVPLQTEYFKPISNGKLSIDSCGGGPKDILSVQLLNNISTSIKARLYEDKNLILFVSFDVPVGDSIRLDSDQFSIWSGSVIKKIKVERIQKIVPDSSSPMGIGSIHLKSVDLLEGSTSKLNNFWGEYDIYEWYRLEFDSSLIAALQDRFSIKYPAIFINGSFFEGPLIEFERVKGIFIYALNC